MNAIFNLDGGLFENDKLNAEHAESFKYLRDVMRYEVHIISEQPGLPRAINLTLRYDLNPNGLMLLRLNDDTRNNSDVIAEYVDLLELTPENTICVCDRLNREFWIENGFKIVR